MIRHLTSSKTTQLVVTWGEDVEGEVIEVIHGDLLHDGGGKPDYPVHAGKEYKQRSSKELDIHSYSPARVPGIVEVMSSLLVRLVESITLIRGAQIMLVGVEQVRWLGRVGRTALVILTSCGALVESLGCWGVEDSLANTWVHGCPKMAQK